MTASTLYPSTHSEKAFTKYGSENISYVKKSIATEHSVFSDWCQHL